MARAPSRPIDGVARFALTRTEAAASIGVSVDHFERHVQPHLKTILVGQLVLIPPRELEAWVTQNARHIA